LPEITKYARNPSFVLNGKGAVATFERYSLDVSSQ